MKNVFLISFIILLNYKTFSQSTLEINASIKTISGLPISYASIFTKNSYGVIANIHGKFRIKVNPSDTLKINSVGFKRKSIVASNLKDVDEIILDSLVIQLPEFIYSNNNKSESFKISKHGRILKNQYAMTTNFWHGTVIQNKILINKKLKSIECKIGFKGEPILPFRLGVFNVDERGLPKENLLRKEVLIYPNHKFEMVSINLEEQNLIIRDSKICIALELINPVSDLLQLNGNYTPYIGIGKIKDQYPVFITNKLNKWVKLGKKNPIFILEFITPD